jgi:hypothetical protein
MSNKPSLTLCIVMDIIGYATYAIPILGEIGDILWAPISAIVFYNTFNRDIKTIGSVVNFIEEILPITDIVPTFTIAYFFFSDKE